MIDLEYTRKQFNEFIKRYDLKNEMIGLKVAHMIRVMKVNMKFAEFQGLGNEDIELAGIIGLLHDIGRFVQIERYGTFIDYKSIDHCQAGVNLLFKDGFIAYFVKDDKYYHIIERAIKNHGQFEIEPGLDEHTLLHCQLIRDSDKTDIFEVMLQENPDTVFDGDYIRNANINEKVKEDFFNNRMINKVDVKTVFDDYVRKVAFIFNYYFARNLQYVKEKNYISRMTERFLAHFKIDNPETQKDIKEINLYANEYIS
ncbi:MAG: HD domain-containing protein [Clostridia bacterium]|nr:HD domain-containing protein [Clostridia bacterium]